MAEFDWMDDPAFRAEVQSAVSRTATACDMSRHDPVIVDLLMRRLNENCASLFQQEMAKAPSTRRTRRDALASVEVLIRQASRFAAAEGSTVVDERDFEKACAAWHCMVWPFCDKSA